LYNISHLSDVLSVPLQFHVVNKHSHSFIFATRANATVPSMQGDPFPRPVEGKHLVSLTSVLRNGLDQLMVVCHKELTIRKVHCWLLAAQLETKKVTLICIFACKPIKATLVCLLVEMFLCCQTLHQVSLCSWLVRTLMPASTDTPIMTSSHAHNDFMMLWRRQALPASS
jgi:hypothetical protein